MALRLFNTLTREKEEFQPIRPPTVTLYVCGVTVYDEAHIGHARGAVVFDVLRRYLEGRYGYRVIHVRNITDVDDKIIDRARGQTSDWGQAPDWAQAPDWGQTPDLPKLPLASERGLTPSGLKERTQLIAEHFTKRFKEDFSRLGLLAPTHEPRATEFIPKMIEFIQRLLDRGMAYEAPEAVYFSLRKLAPGEGYRYGILSGQNLDELKAGARIEPGEGKRDPLDFSLWKKAKPDEPSWDSPWGAGRPGWHIECSTMSTALLGENFDIHGGGQDLIFPHHENEIAQARGAGFGFAKVWLHHGLLTVNGQKMSKSLGNIVTIPQALGKHSAEVLRLFYLSAHYRSPQDFTWEHFDEAAHAYERVLDFLCQVEQIFGDGLEEPSEIALAAQEQFTLAMDDDLNTPEVFAAVYELVASSGAWIQAASSGDETLRKRLRHAAKTVRKLNAILGIRFPTAADVPPAIWRKRDERAQAREAKDYGKSDAIRREVKEAGYLMMDTGETIVVRPEV